MIQTTGACRKEEAPCREFAHTTSAEVSSEPSVSDRSSACAEEGPDADAGLDKEINTLLNGAKVPGLVRCDTTSAYSRVTKLTVSAFRFYWNTN